MDRLLRFAHWAVLLFPAAVVLALILRYGVNLPYWDQWELLDTLIAARDGIMRWDLLVAQHNEHRMPFPKAIMLAAALLTGWNTRVELIIGFLISLGTLGMVAALMRPTLNRLHPLAATWATAAMSGLLFSLAQWENWLWGWQIQWFLTVLALVSAVAFATWSLSNDRPWLYVGAAAIATTVGQFALASGALIWAVTLPIFAVHRDRNRIIPIWIACAVLVCIAYFADYQRPPHHPSPLLALDNLHLTLSYVVMYLSGPLGRDPVTAATIGYAIGIAFVACSLGAAVRHRQDLREVVPWVALGTFAIANAVLTAVGRVAFGVEQALMSRYVTIALLLPIATLMLSLLTLGPRSGSRRWNIGLSIWLVGATALMGATVLGDYYGLAGFRKLHSDLVNGRACVRNITEATDDCLRTVYPHPDYLRDRVRALAASGWSGFPPGFKPPDSVVSIDGRKWHLRISTAAMGWLDSADISGDTLIVSGWAYYPAGKVEVPRRILIVAGEALIGETIAEIERPDVAQHYRSQTMLRTGWTFRKRDAADLSGTKVRAYLVLRDGMLTPIGDDVTIGSLKG